MNARLQIRLKAMVAVSAVSLLMSCASDPRPTREQVSNARFGPAPSAEEVDAAVRQFARVVDPAFHEEASDFLMLPFRSYEPFKGSLYARDRAGGGRHEFGWLVNVYFGGRSLHHVLLLLRDGRVEYYKLPMEGKIRPMERPAGRSHPQRQPPQSLAPQVAFGVPCPHGVGRGRAERGRGTVPGRNT
ncbi:MAG: hypothetical protein KF791_15530 [Verrucomicrobiae bacterium]|nr:hypothetical protein [Verrucomicrobiae bacterium]